MAAEEVRPAWFGNRNLQAVCALGLAYVLVRAVMYAVDGDWAQAFLNCCWGVLLGYVGLESLRARKRQQEREAAGDEPGESTD